MITVYSYAIEILTTNRTDSLQYMVLIAAYKACPPYGARTRYLSLSTPVVIQCAIGHCFVLSPMCFHLFTFAQLYVSPYLSPSYLVHLILSVTFFDLI